MADHRARRDLLVFVSDRAHRQQRSRLRIMNAATDTAAATSSRFGTFALVFGICFAILYVVCEMGAFPMFTYHRESTASIPASRRRAATKDRRCTGMAGSPLLRSAHPSSDFLPPCF